MTSAKLGLAVKRWVQKAPSGIPRRDGEDQTPARLVAAGGLRARNTQSRR